MVDGELNVIDFFTLQKGRVDSLVENATEAPGVEKKDNRIKDVTEKIFTALDR